MSVEHEPAVPASLAAALAPDGPLPEGLTLLLLTVRADGWPHVAMLSAGEVVAVGERRLALALWPGSSAAENLAERPRATLAAVVDEASWALRIEAREAGAIETPLAGRLRGFAADVVATTSDRAPYAVLESGVTFRLKDGAGVRARWAEVRAALAGGAHER